MTRRVLITGVGSDLGTLLAAFGDRALVLELAERTRERVQGAVYSNLVRRGPTFV